MPGKLWPLVFVKSLMNKNPDLFLSCLTLSYVRIESDRVSLYVCWEKCLKLLWALQVNYYTGDLENSFVSEKPLKTLKVRKK